MVLTGSLGMGHHIVTEVVATSLAGMGFEPEVLDCMSLLGPVGARAGDWVFRHLLGIPTLYDGLHFSHLRPGSALAGAMDQAATGRLVPALHRYFQAEPPDLLVSTFATGASAIAKLATATPPGTGTAGGTGTSTGIGAVPGPAWRPTTVVLCTDVAPHRLWVHEGIDLFLVTSHAAAAAVRRHLPTARIAVVPPPVRPAFHRAPRQATARAELGIDPKARCALVMGGGWGLGPVADTAHALAAAGVEVLAVAGGNRRLAQALAVAARDQPRVRPFGFTDRVPLLMAASDVVVTTPGATTCSEARAVGRPLVLLDVVPGHGRDNVQHELELGNADVCDADPLRLIASVLAVLDRSTMPGHGARDTVGTGMAATGPGGTGAGHGQHAGRASTGAAPGATWDAAFAEALAGVTTLPGTPAGATAHPGTPAGATASPPTTRLCRMATEPADAIGAGLAPEEAD